jgi:hypothetical protein
MKDENWKVLIIKRHVLKKLQFMNYEFKKKFQVRGNVEIGSDGHNA